MKVFTLVYELGNTCVSLDAREMIQIQCTCADVDVRPMHSPSVRALDASTSARVHWI